MIASVRTNAALEISSALDDRIVACGKCATRNRGGMRIRGAPNAKWTGATGPALAAVTTPISHLARGHIIGCTGRLRLPNSSGTGLADRARISMDHRTFVEAAGRTGPENSEEIRNAHRLRHAIVLRRRSRDETGRDPWTWKAVAARRPFSFWRDEPSP